MEFLYHCLSIELDYYMYLKPYCKRLCILVTRGVRKLGGALGAMVINGILGLQAP